MAAERTGVAAATAKSQMTSRTRWSRKPSGWARVRSHHPRSGSRVSPAAGMRESAGAAPPPTTASTHAPAKIAGQTRTPWSRRAPSASPLGSQTDDTARPSGARASAASPVATYAANSSRRANG